MKNRICKEYSTHDCYGKPEKDYEYYPTPDNMSDEDILDFAKDIESNIKNSEKIFVDNMSIKEFEKTISKSGRKMEIYIEAILEYRKLKDELEKIVSWWAQAENNAGLDKWNELKITDISYADLDLVATVVETDNEDGYFTYRVPKDILYDNDEIKKWIKDQVHKKIIGSNKFNIELIEDKTYEIEKLNKEIEELKDSLIDINNLHWDDVLNFK